MLRIGNDTVAMPQQFTPAAIGIAAALRLVTYELPEKVSLTHKPGRSAAARHVVVIMDESIGSEMVALREDNPVTPYLWSIRDRIADFGTASSMANCSSTSNAILRYGGGRHDVRLTLKESPYLWEYARLAGFRTVFIDAAASHNKNPDVLQNFMTIKEKLLIDEFVIIDEGDAPQLDRKLAKLLAEILKRSDPHFIYANKNGAHFPYDASYPSKSEIFTPTESNAGGSVTQIHRENSYRNAVRWSVDGFFHDLLGRSRLDNTALLYTSDHGQNLKLGGLPHCSAVDADPSEGRVPLFFLSGDDRLLETFADAASRNRNRADQFAVFPTLLNLFGYRTTYLGPQYTDSLLGTMSGSQTFLSGDLFGMFGDELHWNSIAN